jgi:hypothetical protein
MHTQHSRPFDHDSDSASSSDNEPIPLLIPHQFPNESDSDSEPDFEDPVPNPLQNNPYEPLTEYDSDATDDAAEPSPTYHATNTPIINSTTIAPPSYPIFLPPVNSPISLPDVDIFHGDTLAIPKAPDRTRFLTKNVHHVSTSKTDDELRMHFGDQHRLGIDYLGITEHKLDTTQYSVRQAFIASAKQAFTQHKLELGSSELNTVSTYKPGGTAISAQGNATGRIIFQASDKYGRWSYMDLQGTDDRIVTYITVYQVCKKPTNLQGITAFHQQEIAFRREKRTNTNPRHNFRHDLIRLIQSLQARNHQIILAGDFNEHILDNNTSLQQISQQCQLLDIWKQRFPHLIEPSTYIRGSKRIDYTLISRDLSSAVTAVGYEPFHYTSATDHRGIFIDFDTDKLFGNKTNKLQSSQSRHLNSKYPLGRKTYIEAAAAHGREHNLFQRLQELLDSHTRDDALIENLDVTLGECCDLGERKCKKTRPEWWTLETNRLRIWRRTVQKLKSSILNHIDIRPRLQAICDLHGITRPFPTTVDEATRAITQVRKDIRACLQKSRDTRAQEQLENISMERTNDNQDKAKILQAMHNSEQHTQMYSMFRNIRGKTQQSGLTTVDIPDTWPAPGQPGEWCDPKTHAKLNRPFRQLTIPSEIEYYLMERNRRHFGQAHGTPFTQAPLADLLNWQADTETAELILQGEYTNSELDDVTQLLLKHCAATTQLDTVTNGLTLEEFIGKVRVWRECTSTSPSGRHLGHYKTVTKPIIHACEPWETDNIETGRLELLHAHLNIINYCLIHGYSLKRWQHVVNVMILKEPGNHKIHRLRVIHLFEADYNLILSVKWRQQIYAADKQQLVNPGQYGSYPGREATSLCLLEELKTDISYCSRKPLINFDNDASSCYDRIIVSLSSLINRKYGQNRHVVMVNASTLRDAKYQLKTALGVSDTHIQHSTAWPLYGTGQGSGNSPMIWCFISSTLFDCHQSKAYGAIFQSPDRTVTVSFSMVGFVDDSTGTVNSFNATTQPSPETLLNKMKHDAQLWHDLLWCSGGMLELPKCSYHFLYFDYKPDGTPLPRGGQVGPSLSIKSPTNDDVDIPAKSVFDTHKTLGHYKAPAGTSKTQLLKIQTKQSHLSQCLASSPANATQAQSFYHTIYLPSIYVLGQSFLDPDKLDQAEKKSMPTIFAKCGYNRNTHRSLLYGPTDYCGGGFIRWRWLQGEAQILNFLKNWRTDSQLGQTLRVAVSWYQYAAGVSWSLFEDVTTPVDYTHARWLPSLRAFLSSIDGHFDLDDTYIPPPQREHDTYLMDLVTRSDAFTPDEARIINYCRQYLGVVTLSDITNATGDQLIPGIEWGELDACCSTTTDHTTHQPAPAVFFWTYWQRLLRVVANSAGQLFGHLGTWLQPGGKLRRQWQSYFDYRYKFLYRYVDGQYFQYELFDTRFITGCPTPWKPNDYCVPVTIHETSRDCWSLTHPPSLPTHPERLPIATTFEEYLHQLPTQEQHLFASLDLLHDPFEILAHFNQEYQDLPDTDDDSTTSTTTPTPPTTIHMVSDGSELSQKMTFGWVLCTANGIRLAICSGPAFGTGSSHRAEGTGMLSAARFLYHLSHYCNTQILNPLVYTSDNLGLITRMNQRLQYDQCFSNATLAPDWDLTEAIYDNIQHLSTKPTFQHVLGHQDDHTSYTQLTLPAQLNVDADEAAGAFHWSHAPTLQETVPLLEHTKAHFNIGPTTITGHYKLHIRKAASQAEFFTKCKEIHQWDLPTYQTVNFTLFRTAVRNSCHLHKFLFKFTHQVLPTQDQKSKWSNSSDACPTCHETDTQQHFLRCTSPDLIAWRKTFLRSLRSHLDSAHTKLELMTVLLECTEAWLTGEAINPADYPRYCQRAIQAQTRIGWHAFLQGYWTTEWALLQDAHLKYTRQWTHTCSGRTWATRTITTIWQHIHNGWTLHNDAIHVIDGKLEDADIKTRTHFRIIRLHQRRSETMAIHRDYFFDDADATLQATTLTFQRNWLNLYEPAILESIKMAQTNSIKGTTPLSAYFPVTHPGCRPTPHFDKRLKTRHKGPRRRKPQVNRASQSTHRISRYFTQHKPSDTVNPPRTICTQLPQHRLPQTIRGGLLAGPN